MQTPPGAMRLAKALRFLAAVTALIAARPWPAAAQAPRLTAVGAGAGVSCAEWAAAGRSDPELEQWAFSFTSAVAAAAQLQRGDDPLSKLDAEAIHTWLGGHCRDRPSDTLSAALVRMVYAAPR